MKMIDYVLALGNYIRTIQTILCVFE